MIKVVEGFNLELVMDVAVEGVVNKEVAKVVNKEVKKGIMDVLVVEKVVEEVNRW